MSDTKKFNIRVYGLLLWENRVLVTDEYLWGQTYTKFPGGGLEWGEGIANCLEREFSEEIGIEITKKSLFYLTDFFQPSAFHSNQQVISIYYLTSYQQSNQIPVKSKRFDFENTQHGSQIFRWENISTLNADDFYFPIDKLVVQQLIKHLNAL